MLRISVILVIVGYCMSAGLTPASAQIYRLQSPDTTAGNYFGTAVAIDDSVAIVGASGDLKCGVNAGAAFIFNLSDNGKWEEKARLEPDDCREGLFFGKAVAVSGRRAAVVAYIPFFSGAVSNTVYIFEFSELTDTWEQTAKLRQPPGKMEGAFAAGIALDGDRILITTSGDAGQGAFNGSAYIYDYGNGSWKMNARLSPSLGPSAGIFGTSAALDGDRAVVSASTYVAEQPGSVYVFDRDPESGSWSESAALRGILDFFISVDVDGDRLIVGESRAGAGLMGRARIFNRQSDGKWRPGATLRPSGSYSRGGFGSVVSLRDNHALVVGFDEQLRMDINIDRVVYLFEFDPAASKWYQKHIIDVGDVAFGSAIDLDKNAALIGQADEGAPGNAYVVLIH